jgi:hypothetical protein
MPSSTGMEMSSSRMSISGCSASRASASAPFPASKWKSKPSSCQLRREARERRTKGSSSTTRTLCTFPAPGPGLRQEEADQREAPALALHRKPEGLAEVQPDPALDVGQPDVVRAEPPVLGGGEGQRGVALRIDPSADPKNSRGKEPYRYTVAEDYEIQLHAGDYRGWNAATLSAVMEVEEITIANGWVRGKIEWKGELPNPFDDTQVLTAYSAAFHLPLEEIGPQPAN